MCMYWILMLWAKPFLFFRKTLFVNISIGYLLASYWNVRKHWDHLLYKTWLYTYEWNPCFESDIIVAYWNLHFEMCFMWCWAYGNECDFSCHVGRVSRLGRDIKSVLVHNSLFFFIIYCFVLFSFLWILYGA